MMRVGLVAALWAAMLDVAAAKAAVSTEAASAAATAVQTALARAEAAEAEARRLRIALARAEEKIAALEAMHGPAAAPAHASRLPASSPRSPVLLRKATAASTGHGGGGLGRTACAARRANLTQLPVQPANAFSLPMAAGAMQDLNLAPIANPELHHQVVGSNEWGTPMAQSTLKLWNGKEMTYDEIVYGYNRLWQDLGLWLMQRYQGVPFLQNANDAIVIQMLLWNVQPGFVVEIGTFNGGSALYYSEIMRSYEQCKECTKLLTTDPSNAQVSPALLKPRNYNVEFQLGGSTNPAVLARVGALSAQFSRTLVIHDGDHSYEGVLRDLQLYDKFVTVGSYMVVQDTSLDRLMTPETAVQCHGGAMRAIKDFLAGPGKDRWIVDKTYEFLLFSTNHNGFLRKVAV